MRLEEIQKMDSVAEIFEYIVKNSCYISNTNKNLNIQDWETFDYYTYLVNNFVNKNHVDSSLDYLLISNSRNYKNVHMQDLDVENTVQQSRASILFLMHEYYEGRWDNEVEREFGFKIEGDINKFKRLFTHENIDRFCSFLLTKSQQSERRNLDTRILESMKDENGKWRTVSKYLNIKQISLEQTYEDDRRIDVEQYLTQKNGIENEIDNMYVYQNDNIYTFIARNLHLLTDKQLEFITFYLESTDVTAFEEIFKYDDEIFNKQLKCSYRKNIVTRIERELLSKSDNVKYHDNDYYTLVKSDNEYFLNKLNAIKDRYEQFKLIAKEMKKSHNLAKILNDIVIEQSCINYFITYMKNSETVDMYRYIMSNKFVNLIDAINKIGVDNNATRNRKVS